MGTVRGKVTYQGAPVPNAMVTFLCDGASRMAKGSTDDNGEYQLTSYEANDGAMVGTHVITVIKMGDDDVTEPAPENYTAMSESLDGARMQSARQVEESRRGKSSIPTKYGNRSTTDLKQDVKEGENVVDLTLVD